MNTFLKTYRLALTPLSPIHIGCGEDFEPTNYVIDDGVLYGFDPSRAVLNDLQKGKLMEVANKASLLGIQRFFKDNAPLFKAQCDVLIPVSGGVAQAYEKNVGRPSNMEASGNMVFNRLFIERTAYTGRLRQPYIPGSSFKGAVRTAMLDDINADRRPTEDCGKTSSALEKRLFKGDFETSPMRLLKIADLMAAPGCETQRRVLFAVNRKKARIIKEGQELQPRGIEARKECILHGQYRAFLADAVLPSLDPHRDSKLTPAAELRPTDLKQIARQSNDYNMKRLRREISVLDGRGFVNPVWKVGIEALLAGELGKKLTNGSAFLVRLGRYGGAENKTLSGDGVAQIKIMQGKGQPAITQSTTKTVWLAADEENEQKHLLPFGWAVVEIDPQADLPQLKAWCDAESRGRRDMTQLRLQFEAEKADARKRKAEIAAEAAAREAAKQAELLAEQQRAIALVKMTPQSRLVETLRRKCEDLEFKIAHGNFKTQKPEAGQAGLYQDASKLVQLALNSAEWSVAERVLLADMLELWLPKVVAPWDAKGQRKKLKLFALRGIA